MKFSRRPLVVGLAFATSLAGLGVAATHAGASDPPVVLNPTSGPAGTAIKVTLPSPCKAPKKPAGSSATLYLSFAPASGSAGYSSQNYPLAPGQSVKKVTLLASANARRGHYIVSGSCFVMKPSGFTFTSYGGAYFSVTGGKALPKMKVTPTSGPTGTVIHISATCKPTGAQTSATLAVVLYSATDPSVGTSTQVGGAGPKQHASIAVPPTFAPGAYFVAASCFDYTTSTTFAEQPFTVTAPTRPSSASGRSVARR